VRVAALGGLSAVELAEAGTLLVVTSTYGAGEAPDSARAFARKQMALAPSFKGLDYAVLALGDRKYDATFCGFGRAMDRWLASGKARRLFEVVCVDGDDDEAAMTRWCEQLTRLGADTSVEQLMPGPPQDWHLAERRLLNPGSPGGEAWHIALVPKNPAHLNWTAGDIAEIWPRNSEAATQASPGAPRSGRRQKLSLARAMDFSQRHHRPFAPAPAARSRRHRPAMAGGPAGRFPPPRIFHRFAAGLRPHGIAGAQGRSRMTAAWAWARAG